MRRIGDKVEDGELLIDKFNTEITERKFICLRELEWLNDEIINFYMNMLSIYDQQLCKRISARKKSMFFNSFFMHRLLVTSNEYDYNQVTRWTKNRRRDINIFEMDKIFFPINYRNNHWTLAIIYVQKKEIHYFDTYVEYGNRTGYSYKDKSDYYCNGLLKWVIDEGKRKKVHGMENEWKLINRSSNIPQQNNDNDCGVFTIVCADYLSDDLPLTYNQGHIGYWRMKIATDILRGHLLY